MGSQTSGFVNECELAKMGETCHFWHEPADSGNASVFVLVSFSRWRGPLYQKKRGFFSQFRSIPHVVTRTRFTARVWGLSPADPGSVLEDLGDLTQGSNPRGAEPSTQTTNTSCMYWARYWKGCCSSHSLDLLKVV